MRIKKIILENIRCYKNQEIELPEGSTILSGDIGSGKTTILLAIEFALFGLQPGQKGSSLVSNSSDNAKVILEMEVNGKDIIIERSLKKTNKSVTQDSSFITINGSREEMSVTELKTRILSILNYPEEFIKKTNLLYRYTIYSPQEMMKQIILEDPESRLNILRHVFGVDKYKTIKENLSIITLKLREKSRLIQYELRDLEENKISLSSMNEFVKVLEGKMLEKRNELDEKIRDRKIIESGLEDIEKKIEEKNNFEKEIEKTVVAMTYKTQERKRIEEEIEAINEKINASKGFDQRLLDETYVKIKETNEKIDSISNELIRISAALQSLEAKQKSDLIKKERIFKIDICPTCLQDVPETHKHNILNETEKEIARAKKEMSIIEERRKELQSEIEFQKNRMSDLLREKSDFEILKLKSHDISLIKENLSKLIKGKEELESDSMLLEKHISLLKKSVMEFSKYDNFFSLRNDELKIAFQKEKRLEIELAEYRKELEISKKDIERLDRQIMKKEALKDDLSKTIELEQWMSTNFSDLISFIEKNIMLRLRNEFSKYFNKWFSMLTTDNFYVRLDESFTPIITQGDYELDYAFLSGGERTAVALAYRLSLNQIINSMHSKINTQDIVILDEPTEGFSSQQLDKIRDVLQELNVKQLIIVSHEPKIEGFVDNIIKIRKESGISSIVS